MCCTSPNFGMRLQSFELVVSLINNFWRRYHTCNQQNLGTICTNQNFFVFAKIKCCNTARRNLHLRKIYVNLFAKWRTPFHYTSVRTRREEILIVLCFYAMYTCFVSVNYFGELSPVPSNKLALICTSNKFIIEYKVDCNWDLVTWNETCRTKSLFQCRFSARTKLKPCYLLNRTCSHFSPAYIPLSIKYFIQVDLCIS